MIEYQQDCFDAKTTHPKLLMQLSPYWELYELENPIFIPINTGQFNYLTYVFRLVTFLRSSKSSIICPSGSLLSILLPNLKIVEK